MFNFDAGTMKKGSVAMEIIAILDRIERGINCYGENSCSHIWDERTTENEKEVVADFLRENGYKVTLKAFTVKIEWE